MRVPLHDHACCVMRDVHSLGLALGLCRAVEAYGPSLDGVATTSERVRMRVRKRRLCCRVVWNAFPECLSADFCTRQLFVKMGPALRVPLYLRTFLHSVCSRVPTRRDGRGAMGADDVSNPLAPDYANPVPEKPTPKSNADFRKVSADSRDGSQFPATA